MEHYVITIESNEKSVKAADRCIKSGHQYGLKISKWAATTPKNTNIVEAMTDNKINDRLFNDSLYSREDNARAAFLSHFSLWKYCVETRQEITVFEHDAVIVAPIPNMMYNGFISLGKPSYGFYKTPPILGVNKLTSKQYLPGAHAYRLKPKAAQLLIDEARMEATPTDMFINIKRFPFIQEYYPWPVECRDSFTTIQKDYGCVMKHGYNENYKIEEV